MQTISLLLGMMFHPDRRPDLCISPFDTRPALTAVAFSKTEEGAFLTATDSYILLRIRVEDAEADGPGLIAPDVIASARRNRRRTNGRAVIDAYGDCASAAYEGGMFLSVPISSDVCFPHEKTADVIRDVKARPKKFRVALNAERLKTLADAMGTENVVLSFSAHDEPILVEHYKPNENDIEAALLMPANIPQHFPKLPDAQQP